MIIFEKMHILQLKKNCFPEKTAERNKILQTGKLILTPEGIGASILI